MDTQDPVSWSDALFPIGMRFACCPTDVRRIIFYKDELIRINDLSLLRYYTESGEKLLNDPNECRWLCDSHVVILHKDRIIDHSTGEKRTFDKHRCMDLSHKTYLPCCAGRLS